MTPEAKARLNIDALLQQAGWHVSHTRDAKTNLVRAFFDSLIGRTCKGEIYS